MEHSFPYQVLDHSAMREEDPAEPLRQRPHLNWRPVSNSDFDFWVQVKMPLQVDMYWFWDNSIAVRLSGSFYCTHPGSDTVEKCNKKFGKNFKADNLEASMCFNHSWQITRYNKLFPAFRRPVLRSPTRRTGSPSPGWRTEEFPLRWIPGVWPSMHTGDVI